MIKTFSVVVEDDQIDNWKETAMVHISKILKPEYKMNEKVWSISVVDENNELVGLYTPMTMSTHERLLKEQYYVN